MLHILAQTQSFPREAELLLDGFVRRDEPGGIVGAEEIPGVEAGEVLKGAEEFVAADCGEKSVSNGVQRSYEKRDLPVVATKRR